MIFSEHLAGKILSGEKTVTRRPVSYGLPCRYKVNRTYAVQPGRGYKAVARIAITDVEKQCLGEIDNADAVREGFDNAAIFLAYWQRLYPGGLDLEQFVYRIEFSVVP